MKTVDNVCIVVNNTEEFKLAQEIIFKHTNIGWAHGGNKIVEVYSDCLVIRNNTLYHRPRRNKEEELDEEVVHFKDLERFFRPTLSKLLEEL